MDSNIRFPVAEIVIEGSNANSPLRQTVTRRRCKCAQRGRFAPDSLLEGNGFELQFLVARLSTVMGDGPAVPRSERICCGTEGSNPSPSSSESGANLTLFFHKPPAASITGIGQSSATPSSVLTRKSDGCRRFSLDVLRSYYAASGVGPSKLRYLGAPKCSNRRS